MLLRLFTGSSWSSAEELGDYEFDEVPAIGHKLAIAADGTWLTGQVRDVVHRLVEPQEPADIALLIGAAGSSPCGDEPLPLARLDALNRGDTKPVASVPRAGPWGG